LSRIGEDRTGQKYVRTGLDQNKLGKGSTRKSEDWAVPTFIEPGTGLKQRHST
jgi:hypothetical protein